MFTEIKAIPIQNILIGQVLFEHRIPPSFERSIEGVSFWRVDVDPESSLRLGLGGTFPIRSFANLRCLLHFLMATLQPFTLWQLTVLIFFF